MDGRRTSGWIAAIALAAGLPLTSCGPSDDGATASGSHVAPRTASATPEPEPAPASGAQTAPAGPARTLPHDLEKRAEVFWQATVAEDWPTVFLFRDPRDAGKVTVDEFAEWSRTEEPFVTHSYRINDTIVRDDVAWVSVDLSTSMRKFPGAPRRDVQRWQVWRQVEGEWYPVPILELESYPNTPAMRDAAEEARLRKRFEESWAARRANDWTALYEMADPRDHPRVPFDQFERSFERSTYLDAEIFWVEVIGDAGRVRLRFRHKINDPSLSKMPPKVVVAVEDWVKFENEWYMDLVKPEQ